MSTVELIVVPVVGTAGLAVVGAAPAALLRRLAADVRAALVLPVGAAIVACSSTLLLLGIPVRVIGVMLATGGTLAAVAARRHLRALARGLTVPAVVLLVALSLASIPAIAAQSWDAASSGNGDIYWWVSQSRAFLDGPAPPPAADHPDRAMYERVTEGDEPFGTPFGLSLLSLASGNRPESVFSAFGALVAAVLALTVFAVARTALRWRPVQAGTGASLAAGNAFLLFATFFGWQSQLLITTFGLLSLGGMYGALESGPVPEFVVLGGLGAAAGICIYGPVFGPFVAFGVFVVVAYRAVNRDARARQRIRRAAGAVALLTATLGAVPIVRSLLVTGSFLGAASNASAWAGSQRGLPSEPLGLVPRLGWSARPSGGWSALSLAIATPLYAAGFRAARREHGKVILFWGSAAALTAVVLLALLAPNPYLSLKVAGYAAPLLMLTVFAAVRVSRSQPLLWVAWGVAAGLGIVLFLASTAVVELRAIRTDHHATTLAGLEGAVRRLPPNARVAVDVGDAWNQSWAVYYLRERRIVIRQPQYFVPAAVAAAQRASRGPVQYVVSKRPSGRVVWRGGGLVLSAVSS